MAHRALEAKLIEREEKSIPIDPNLLHAAGKGIEQPVQCFMVEVTFRNAGKEDSSSLY
jgi:hypothetical protein